MAATTFWVHRHFDENEYEREGRNGRMYRGRVGWRWLLFQEDEHGPAVLNDYRTKRQAVAAMQRAQEGRLP